MKSRVIRWLRGQARTAGINLLCPAILIGAVSAQVVTRVSVSSGGSQASALSSDAQISADGRYVVFSSDATNVVAGDVNGFRDVFLRDRIAGTTTLVSVDSAGIQGNGLSSVSDPSPISADGRYVVFYSSASNLVAGDTNAVRDVFLRDMQTNTTTRVSVSSASLQGNGLSSQPTISADGRYVAFYSSADNLIPGDTNQARDCFVRDMQTGATARISVSSSGFQANAQSSGVVISANGQFAVFYSDANNLVSGDSNAFRDVFLRDLQANTTTRISVSTSGTQGNKLSSGPVISGDGRYVAFYSDSDNLVSGDTNAVRDVFLRDRQTNTTTRISVSSSNAQGSARSEGVAISDDGRFVGFDSDATNMVAGDTNAVRDTFLRDRQAGTTIRVNVSSSGVQGNSNSADSSLSADGRFVAFGSYASNLVSGDTNAVEDVFVYDRTATAFTSLCDPGVGGVLACPCANPPSGAGRGCNNSAGTGGASLAAGGVSYLSNDSLIFTTAGEKPTATSILLQGTTSPPAGIVYGQGVRCVGGSLKRLFVKSAVAGSIIAPNFGAGDPTVSARSAAKGDAIQAGQSRWYLVYYRDPTVLGGCPPSSTFNATQTGRIDWSL